MSLLLSEGLQIDICQGVIVVIALPYFDNLVVEVFDKSSSVCLSNGWCALHSDPRKEIVQILSPLYVQSQADFVFCQFASPSSEKLAFQEAGMRGVKS